jgi:DNA repair protein RAD50
VERQILKLYDEIEALRVEEKEKGALIGEVIQKENAAWQKANTAGQIVGELNGKRIEERSKEESVQSLLENLDEMTDSDEALQNMLEQYEERVQVYEDDLERQKGHYNEIEQQVQDTRNQVSAKERECGSYEAQKQSYDRQVQNREKLIKESARTHGIRGFDMDIDDKQVQAFMERISKLARDQNTKLENARQETRDELQRIQAVLNRLNEERTAATQRKESARQAMLNNDNKINRLQGDLNKINIDEGAKVAMESNLQETETKLEAAKSDMASADYAETIKCAEADLRKLDDQKEKLDAELVEGTRQAGDSARLDFVQKELKGKQSSLETMIGAHGDRIAAVVGQEWTPATVESKFQSSLDQHRAQVTDAEKQRDGTSRELQQVDYKLADCRRDLKSRRTEVKQAEKAIRDAVDAEPANYLEEVKKLEEGRDIVKADADSVAQILDYLDSCLKAASHGCRTCTRKFANDHEKEKMIKTVENEKKKYQKGGGEAKQDLEELEKDLQAARAVSSDFDTWERLTQKEIPALERNEKELAEKRERLISQAEDQDATVSDHQSAKRDVESMSKTVQTISNYSNEITNFESQIEELVSKQKAAGLSRGLEMIQEEIKKVNTEARNVKSRLAKSTGDRERQKAYISSLELEKSNINGKISNAEYQLKDMKSLESQIEDHKTSNGEYREIIRSCDKELEGLAPQLKQEQVKYDDTGRRGADRDRELQAVASKLDSNLNQLRMADEEISEYIQKGGPQQLARGRREVETLKGEITRLEQEKGSVIREVKTLEEKLRNHSDTRRSISDNQRYRRDLRALQAVRAEIAQLETHNAEEDKANYEREGNKYGLERTKLSADKASIVGSLKSKDEEFLEKQQEYETEYKNAARRYKEAHIKVETTQACHDDLGRYGGALDKAIMKYHSIKMEEINRIIDELWRKTYQGTDVDTIMIRSESETNAANKSYNYRVCMVKQDAEMDMRGRCSAGQKVLASIIIRLALAECFGVNCGLIALDEPTTNLDRDNIRALAESLSEIIKMRKAQKNFQLIVITHDEEFLRYMGCSEYAQSYYRVSRNDRQKSIIEKQNIAEVM